MDSTTALRSELLNRMKRLEQSVSGLAAKNGVPTDVSRMERATNQMPALFIVVQQGQFRVADSMQMERWFAGVWPTKTGRGT